MVVILDLRSLEELLLDRTNITDQGAKVIEGWFLIKQLV